MMRSIDLYNFFLASPSYSYSYSSCSRFHVWDLRISLIHLSSIEIYTFILFARISIILDRWRMCRSFFFYFFFFRFSFVLFFFFFIPIHLTIDRDSCVVTSIFHIFDGSKFAKFYFRDNYFLFFFFLFLFFVKDDNRIVTFLMDTIDTIATIINWRNDERPSKSAFDVLKINRTYLVFYYLFYL